jgi:hypothetical protein
MYGSIYCSSYASRGGLMDYKVEYLADEERPLRQFVNFISQDSIFGASGYSWGARDRIFHPQNGHIEVFRYRPYSSTREITSLGRLEAPARGGVVVDGAAAVFGTVVEYEQDLAVFMTDGNVWNLGAEPVNWRVFPRAVFYSNHLHVIGDSALRVFSFNHDYWVNQATKLAGIRRTEERKRSSARSE